MRVCFRWCRLLNKRSFFTRVTAEPEIIGAWFAKVFLDGISQQTNVEATWSESKETKSFLKISAPPKKGNSNKTTHLPKTLCFMFVCVFFPISVSSCTIHVNYIENRKHTYKNRLGSSHDAEAMSHGSHQLVVVSTQFE